MATIVPRARKADGYCYWRSEAISHGATNRQQSVRYRPILKATRVENPER